VAVPVGEIMSLRSMTGFARVKKIAEDAGSVVDL
jgi:hypothetical protein